MTEQDNKESLVSSLPDPEDQYKTDVHILLGKLFRHFILDDLPASQKGQDSLIKQKLPVFTDALKRGQVVVVDLLKKEGISQDSTDGLTTRKYFMEGELIRWQTIPQSSDPFKQMEFLKKIKNSGLETEGESDLGTDPMLLELMLNEGIKQQEAIYNKFVTTFSTIKEIQQFYGSTLSCLWSPQLAFEPIIEAYQSLDPKQGDLKDQFVTKFLSTNYPILEKSHQALEMSQTVRLLHNLFPQDHKLKHISTFVVELLTNPANFTDKSLKEPITTTQKVTHIIKINNLLETFPPEEQITLKQLVINQALEKAEKPLTNLFQQLDIDPSVGIEYVTSLVTIILKNLPGKEYVYFDPETNLPAHINQLLTLKYNLQDLTYIPENSPAPERLMEPTDFIDIFVYDHRFLGEYFAKYPEKEKIQILENIIQASQHQEKVFSATIHRLFKITGLKLKLQDNHIEIVNHRTKFSRSSWLNFIRGGFLKICYDRINHGDNRLIQLFDDMLTSSVVEKFLVQVNPPGNSGKYVERMSFTGKNREAALNQAVKDAASYTLYQYFLFRESRQETFDQWLDVIIQMGMRKYEGTKQYQLEYELEEIDVEEFRKRAKIQLDSYLVQLREQYLPSDYQVKQKEYLNQALEKAIDKYSSTN